MAIQIYCKACKTSNALEAKVCKFCGVTFDKSNRKYRVCVSVKGERINRIVDNLSIAREIEPTLKADVLRGEFAITQKKKCLTLGDLWERYLPWAKENKRSWLDDQLYYQKHIKPRLAEKKLDAITPMDIERLKSEMRKETHNGKPYAPATIKHQLVIIRRLYNLAGKWGLYEGSSPIKSVSMPKIDNKVTEFLSRAELKQLLDTLESWPFVESARFVKFALLTGLRRGELCKLQWDDVDMERGYVTLREPKGGKTTVLPISEEALAVLQAIERNGAFVFPGENGQQRKGFKGPWERIRKAAGLPDDFRFHGLRHHFASTLVSNGVDLAIVKELLTHKDITTTQRYAHLAPEALKRAALQSGKLLNGVEKKVARMKK